ncbi:MAG: hypothetical protein LBS49_14985 [Candidatus Accumulibacter sp.]|nr:hypothetical protein [Accumulibacter sp.]
MIEIVLSKPHTHGGYPLAAGDRLQVGAADAEWLLKHGVAELPSSPGRGRKEKLPKPHQGETRNG